MSEIILQDTDSKTSLRIVYIEEPTVEYPIVIQQVIVQSEDFKETVLVEFDLGDREMLLRQFTFLYRQRFTDFVFESIDGKLSMKVAMNNTGNITADINLRSYIATIHFPIHFERSYLPVIISQLKSVNVSSQNEDS